MQGYVSLNSIVKDAMIDVGEDTEHLYTRFLHWAFEAVKDFHFDTAREVVTKKIKMHPTKTVDFPLDFVDWVKLGIVAGDRLWTYGVNARLSLYHNTDECGNPIGRPTHEYWSSSPSVSGGYWFNNYNGYNLFGYGGACHNSGYYRVNRKERQIQFSSEVNTSDVYMEYITNGANLNGATEVHSYAGKLVKLYIHWMRKENNPVFSMSAAERARTLYYNELRIVRARLSDFSVQDLIEASRKGYLDRLSRAVYQENPANCPIEEPPACSDVFPQALPDNKTKEKYRFWGISKESDIAGSASPEQHVQQLQSELSIDKVLSKTLDATGGYYLYFVLPVSFGTPSFIFNTFPTTFLQQQVSLTFPFQAAEDYYICRSLNLQNGNNLTVEIQ